ncbi:LPXTG cell wall anchor domain-containing protein [Streptococcus pneumoniae]|nr:LPXTG cell wall anchor domain-containing protein [Streptococcus pneumoniae]
MDNKQLKKLAVVSAITLFSSTILSSTNFQNGKLQLGTSVVLAEDPPEDEELPDANEQKAIKEARDFIQGIREWLADGEQEFAEEDFAILEADHLPVLNNIPNIEKKAPGLLADIEKLRAEVFGGVVNPDPEPTVTEEKVAVPVDTVYIEDTEAEANTKTVVNEGTPGEITYVVTNGVRDDGTETKAMVPKQIKVGVKPTVVREEIPAPADIEEKDSELEEGQRVLKSAGTKGSRTTTTTYSLDLTTGEAVANTPTVEETPGTAAVYRVGTKKVAQPPVVTTRTEVIPVTTVYTADSTKEANSQEVTFEGTAGEKTYTTTDGVEDEGVVTTVMKPKQVTVGTKPTVVTEVLPAPADIEEEDPTLEEGKRELKTPATDGNRTTTTTYTLNPDTGEAVANEPVVEETPGTAAVYRVGTKKVVQPPVVTTRTEVIPVTTVYTEDPTKEANSQEVTFEGSLGERTYTTTDGVEDDGVVTKVMQPKQVTVGTKPTVVTEVLPAPADVEEPDFNLEEGKRELKTPAVDGSRTTTTTYSLDPSTGLVTANEPVVEETPGTAAVYRVGTKKVAQPPVVTTRTEVIPVTTVYTEDPTKEANSQEVTFEGSLGERTYTTTDGVEDDGVVTKVMQPKQVTVGTKPTVVTEVLPAPADVEEPDFNLEEGKRELKTPAVDGSRTTTTTYSLDPSTGLVTANEPVVEETPGTAAVYRVGLKKLTPISVPEIKEETETEIVGFTTEKRENPDLPKGETRVLQKGKDGVRTITYRVTTVDGIETGRVVLSDETTPAVVEIIEVGTKDIAGTPVVTEEMVTEAIGFTTEKRENPDLPKGETRVIQAGKDGVRTITYRVITVDGIETSRVVVSDESVAPVAEIIEVGTKVVSSSDETTNQSSTNVATTTNPIVTSQLTKVIKTTIVKKELPKTGEQQSMLTMVGIALLGMVTAIFTLGKKKPKN